MASAGRTLGSAAAISFSSPAVAGRPVAIARPVIAVCSTRFQSDLSLRPSSGQVFLKRGPGGRSSVSGHVATVYGSTGFLGRYVVPRLARSGTQVVVAYRGTEYDQKHLKPGGDLGMVVSNFFQPRDEKSIVETLRNSDVVYNLIGRDYKTKNFTFDETHIDIPRRIARLARQHGVSKFVHVSALNASENSPSQFLRTKWYGEQAVREEFPDATIVRPATMYGAEDRFFNRYGTFMVFYRAIQLVKNGQQKIRPVYVGDVAEALESILRNEIATGETVELAGNQEFTLRQVIDVMIELSHRNPVVISLPKGVIKAQAAILDKVSNQPIISPDEVERMDIDDVLNAGTLRFAELGVAPQKLGDLFIRFARMYRTSEWMDIPWEPITAKLSKVPEV
ncbi:NAD(P)-binding protein [Gonapodya prolifera JEL478]|uniref:NAD(P)-binding protein n=1 Tax=Gonapodya prolifera (strain JEL478) TaxID=1344416 RepID=A0A139A860_GONPJ|nr:NAD(P)-binding protein [Gonapodya prolifera JEL478]|eukprot:KXS12635.1 NAD(P)-binding protein [Gonapodya prolifera JEL478]